MAEPRIMADAKQLAALGSTYSRGLDIARYDVSALEVRVFDGIHHIRGTVLGSGSKKYQVGADISVTNRTIKGAWCTCPAAKNYDGLCKHEIGLIGRYLAAENLERLYGFSPTDLARGPKPQHITADEKSKTIPPLPANAHTYTVGKYKFPAGIGLASSASASVSAGQAADSGSRGTTTSGIPGTGAAKGQGTSGGASGNKATLSGPAQQAAKPSRSPAKPAKSAKLNKQPKPKPTPPEAATSTLVLDLIAGMARDSITPVGAEKSPGNTSPAEQPPELAHVEMIVLPARDPYSYSSLPRAIPNVWTLKLRVSRGKASYQVKHLDEVVQAWETGSALTYGKNLSFVHNRSAFDQSSNALLELFARILFSQEAAFVAKERAWGGKSIANANSINVSGEDVVDLLNTQRSGKVTYDPDLPAFMYSGQSYGRSWHATNQGATNGVTPFPLPKKASLLVTEGDPELTVRVTKGENGGYDLSVGGAVAAVFGKGCCYLVTNDAFTFCSKAFYRRMNRFCEMMLPCYRPYHVRANDMQSFMGTVFPALEGMVTLDLAPGVEDMVPPEPEFAFRISAEKGIVRCVASVSYGERTLSLFERAQQGQPPRDIARETEAQRLVVSLFPYGVAPVPDYTNPAPDPKNDPATRYDYYYSSAYIASRGYIPGTLDGYYGDLYSWDEVREYLGLPRTMVEPAAPWFAEQDTDALYQLLSEGLGKLSELGEVYLSRNLETVEIRDVPDVHVNASVSGGLLDLEVKMEGLSPADIMAYLASYQKKQRYIRLSNGDIMRLGQGLGAVTELADGLGISVQSLAQGVDDIPVNRTLFVDALLKRADGVRLDRNDAFRHIVRDFDTIADADFKEPESLERILRPYQAEGFKWLSTLARTSFGGILADDMGLGKTLQVLCYLLARREGDQGQTTEQAVTAGQRPAPALVVCPASLVYNWMDEIHRFTPSLDAVAVLGSKSERRDIIEDAENYDLLVTSYDLMKRDIKEYELLHLGVVVLDEAQYIKTPSTQVAKCAKRLVADQRFACTGTPVENNLGELWSIFDFLMPGILGSRDSFRKRFERPIAAGDEATAHRLQCLVSPFILRRLKSDVLKDLPEKNENVVYATLEGEQGKLYQANAARIALTLSHQMPEEFSANRIAILAELTRLRQICCDPHLAYENYEGSSAKLETCLELVRNAIDGGHQVLLFSQFTSMLDIIAARLKKERIGYFMLTGATSKKERAALVAQFQASKAPVFLISLKAGGVGLNLTAADVVIHYDPWWNLAAQNQATDRAHRIGQKRTVSVFKLIAKGTIEEKILEMQNAKHDLAESVLGGEAASSTKLTRDDVLALLDAGTESE